MTAVETGPDRLASLREAAGDMDEALRDEGFDAFGSHAVFVRWQRASVEALGGHSGRGGKGVGSAGRKGLRMDRKVVAEVSRRRGP